MNAIPNVVSIPKAAETTWNLLRSMIAAARKAWHLQHYQVLVKNSMELHDGKGDAIETQSRIWKRKTVWRTRYASRPRWPQIEQMWSMPPGTRFYVCQTENIDGRKRIRFRALTTEGPVFVWAEKI